MDHAASDGQIDRAGGRSEIGEALEARALHTVRIDTCDGTLAALGHVLERHAAAVAPDARPGLGSSGAFRWRLLLHRVVPSSVPGADDPIDVSGPDDGSVPRVLETLLAGVTRGRPLEPVEPPGGLGPFDEVGPLGRRADRTPPRRTNVLAGLETEVAPDATIDRTVRAMGTRAARTLVGLDPLLRLDALPGDVHEARSAVRRLRSELHAVEHLLRPGRTERLRAELGWLGGVLGTVRDLDVVLDHLADASSSDDPGTRLVRIRLRNQRRLAALILRNAIASPRVRRTYDELLEFAHDPWFAKGVDPQRKVRRAALEAVRVTDRRLAGAVRGIGDPPDPARLLEVRRRAKACRHVCELMAGPLGSGRLAEAMVDLQTTLGSLQDAAVIDAWLSGPHRPLLDRAEAAAVAALTARAAEQRYDGATGWPAAWVRAQADALRPWLD